MADVKLLAKQINEALKGATITVTGELLQQVTSGYVKVIERARGEIYTMSEIQEALDKVREKLVKVKK